jgi:hypothetical protein
MAELMADGTPYTNLSLAEAGRVKTETIASAVRRIIVRGIMMKLLLGIKGKAKGGNEGMAA